MAVVDVGAGGAVTVVVVADLVVYRADNGVVAVVGVAEGG